MKPIIVAMTVALALAAYWIEEEFPCFFEAGTDACVGCEEDCLDPQPEQLEAHT